MILEIILTIAIIWISLALIIPLFLPNQLLKMPIKRTEKIKKVANRLKGKTKEETLRKVYNYVTKNYEGIENQLKLANYPRLFLHNVEKLLDKKQFLACHIQNQILITLLINTGQFKYSDFKRKETLSYFTTLHQYILVKIDGNEYKVDPFFKVLKKI
jgi:hypothetical protein